MSQALRLTEEDWGKLTPDQRLQVRRYVNSGKDGRELARRYIATITRACAANNADREEFGYKSSSTTERWRDEVMAKIPTSPVTLLNRVKRLPWFTWQDERFVTTSQLAKFYQVPRITINAVGVNHRQEFEDEGLEYLHGEKLRQAKSEINGLRARHQLALWSPRAALRLCLLLRKSDIAAGMRAYLERQIQ